MACEPQRFDSVGRMIVDAEFRLDVFIDEAVIIEGKAVEWELPVFKAQILTYMKLTRTRPDFPINFNVPLI